MWIEAQYTAPIHQVAILPFNLSLFIIHNLLYLIGEGWLTRLGPHDGDPKFGGCVFDRLLMSHFNELIIKQFGKNYDVFQEDMAYFRQQLRKACISVKEKVACEENGEPIR